MAALKKATCVVLLLLFFHQAFANEEEPLEAEVPENEEEMQIRREMIEKILRSVSDKCKAELQIAIKGEKELSEECRIEIQTAATATTANPQAEAEAEPGKDLEGVHPIVHIGAFITFLVIAVSLYVYWINKELSAHRKDKKAKKNKKKAREMWSIGG